MAKKTQARKLFLEQLEDRTVLSYLVDNWTPQNPLYVGPYDGEWTFTMPDIEWERTLAGWHIGYEEDALRHGYYSMIHEPTPVDDFSEDEWTALTAAFPFDPEDEDSWFFSNSPDTLDEGSLIIRDYYPGMKDHQ